ncbi:hypothetical protein LINPERHAP1_LOCUS24165, partial [Linum perenne]
GWDSLNTVLCCLPVSSFSAAELCLLCGPYDSLGSPIDMRKGEEDKRSRPRTLIAKYMKSLLYNAQIFFTQTIDEVYARRLFKIKKMVFIPREHLINSYEKA